MQARQRSDRTTKFWMVLLPRVIIISVILLASLGIGLMLIMTRSSNKMKPPASATLFVQTMKAEHRATQRVWSGYGTVRTMGSADLVAEVSGQVIERPASVEIGQRVQEGQLIVRLDDTDSINALDSARQAARALEAQIDGLRIEQEQLQTQVQFLQEEVAASQRDLDRTDEAIAAGAGTSGERDSKLAALLRSKRELSVLQQQLDLIPSRRATLEAQLSGQRANERIAQENVQRATIQAPFAGELQSVNTREGDWLGVGSPVARLVDLSRLEVPLKVSASASSWINVNDPVHIWVGEPLGEPDKIGRIVRIAPEAENASRTMLVFVEIDQDPSDQDRILPGQFVAGRVLTNDPVERMVLPRRVVQSNRVFVANKNQSGVRKIEVAPVRIAYSFEASLSEIDPEEDQWVALEIGYEPVVGSDIVISLLDQLSEEMKVRIEGDPEVGVSSDPDVSEGSDLEGETESGVTP